MKYDFRNMQVMWKLTILFDFIDKKQQQIQEIPIKILNKLTSKITKPLAATMMTCYQLELREQISSEYESNYNGFHHYCDIIMHKMASQITSLTIVYLTVYSVQDQTKHQSSASLAFVQGIHRWPVNSLHKGPVMRKMFPFDDVIMKK